MVCKLLDSPGARIGFPAPERHTDRISSRCLCAVPAKVTLSVELQRVLAQWILVWATQYSICPNRGQQDHEASMKKSR